MHQADRSIAGDEAEHANATMSSSSYPRKKAFYYIVSLVFFLPLTLLCLTFLTPFPDYLRNPVSAAAIVAGRGRVCCGRRHGVAVDNRVASAAAPAAAVMADVGEGGGPELSVLVGVHTVARKHSRRHLLRMAYAVQQTAALRGAARVDVRFVLCARPPLPPEHRAFVALEARAYGDVLVLDCAERADRGKTYTYFADLPAMMLGAGRHRSPPYDYVMKVDDDTYLQLDALVETLQRAPREDMYYGAGLPFMDRKSPPFMLGMGYLLSWDLVEWIAGSDMVRREAKGAEDVTTGRWLNMGNKAKNRVNIYPRMYDYRSSKPEDFLNDTVAVHQLKGDLRFAHTLQHFNATVLPPSSQTKNLL